MTNKLFFFRDKRENNGNRYGFCFPTVSWNTKWFVAKKKKKLFFHFIEFSFFSLSVMADSNKNTLQKGVQYISSQYLADRFFFFVSFLIFCHSFFLFSSLAGHLKGMENFLGISKSVCSKKKKN